MALLLQNGADVNELHGDGTTALIAACENGSLPIVTALRDHRITASLSAWGIGANDCANNSKCANNH